MWAQIFFLKKLKIARKIQYTTDSKYKDANETPQNLTVIATRPQRSSTSLQIWRPKRGKKPKIFLFFYPSLAS
jgi:hypothetical protein